MVTVDLKSMQMSGAFSFPRCRVMWRDGLLRVFTKQGMALEVLARQPVPVSGGLVRKWKIETARGEVLVRGKCISCGGMAWLRVLKTPGDDLWASTW